MPLTARRFLRRPIGFASLTAGVLALLLSAGGSSFLMAVNNVQSWLIWANVASDLVLVVSYVVILGCLFWIAVRLRRLPKVHGYLWVFSVSGLFFLACASTRAMEVVTVWWAVYRLSVLLKMVCAITSVGTAVLFVRAAPEIKLAEEARERLAAVIDSSDDAIFSKDFGGIITAWNRGAEKVLGYAASDALGKSTLMLMPADRLDEESNILERIRRGERIEHFETVRVRNDGSRIDVSVTLSPVRNGDGVIIGASTIARDITERKRSELTHAHQTEQLARQAQELLQSQNALEAQQSLLQSVLDSIGEGLIVADKNGKFLIWNPVAERLFGSPAALPACEWSAYYGIFMPDKVTPLPVDQLPLVRAFRGETCSSETFIRRRGADETFWLECNASPLHDKDGALQGGVVAFRDISQRKADEAKIANRTLQLEATNRELEAFTYTVSHDLRAPSRHISSFAGILLEDYGAGMNGEAMEHLRRIQDAAIRMGQLVDGLLNMAKLGRQSLRLRPTSLNALVDDVIANLQQECDGREVEWRIDVLPTLTCDPVLIAQVFHNLLDNALKYSRGRKPAIIEIGCCESPDQRTVIFVRDNGVGFDMNYAGNLFGVFERMHTESDFEGTGVGLAASQRIVQKHGGAIWAEAQTDQGASFFFTLDGNDFQTKAIQALATA